MEEASKILMNKDFCDIDSEDSLNCEIKSDTTSVSYSEIGSDPENDFSGTKILIPKEDATSGAEVIPLNCGKQNIATTSRERIRKCGGRRVQNLIRGPRAWVRGPGTRGGTIHRNAPSNEQVGKSNANTSGLPAVSDDEQISNSEESVTLIDDATVEKDEGGNWTENNPNVQNFVFNQHSSMNIDVSDNASPMYSFELLLVEQLIQELVIKTNEYADKTINSSRRWRRRSNSVNWKDVIVDEMKKFIGIVFAMGLVSLRSYKNCWSKDPVYKNYFFVNCYE